MKCFPLSYFLLAMLAIHCVQAGEDEDWGNDNVDSFAPNPVSVGDVSPTAKSGQMSAALPTADQSFGGSHGSNYVGYNQPCGLDGQPGQRCNPNQNLACDMGVCKCRNSTTEPDLVNIWSPVTNKCVPVAREADNWACEQDLQCKASRMGKYAICRYKLNTCQCADVDPNGRDIVRVDDVCYVKKEIGSTCSNDLECSATIKGKAVCAGEGLLSSAAGICGCAGGHIYDSLLNACLELGTSEESNCVSDRQCNPTEALGELARCNPETGKCQCWDTKHNLEFSTAFYKLTHTCYYKRAENEDCKFREECVLGFHRKADCLVHPAYNDGKVCQCPAGEVCTGAAGHVTSTLSIFLLTVAALLVKSF